MAKFTGSGTFTLPGTDSLLHDVQFTTAVTLSGEASRISNIDITGTLTVSANYVNVVDSSLRNTSWSGTNAYLDGALVVVDGVSISGVDARITNNVFAGGDGLTLASDRAVVTGNKFNSPSTNGITVTGDYNLITGNWFTPGGASDAAVTISTGSTGTVFVGNHIGDESAWSVAAIDDNSTSTVTAYPGSTSIGDNFGY